MIILNRIGVFGKQPLFVGHLSMLPNPVYQVFLGNCRH